MRFFSSLLAMLCVFALTACSPPERKKAEVLTPAPSAAEASPKTYEVLAQNDYLRLLYGHWNPGDRDELHSHPPFAVYFLTDFPGRIHYADGTKESFDAKAGQAMVKEGETSHAIEYLGEGTGEMLVVERMEEPVEPMEGASPLSTDVSPDVYKILAENDKLRVVLATWEPGQRDIFHSHPPFAVYLLTDIDGLLYQGNGIVAKVQRSKGKGSVLYPDPSHSFENLSDQVSKMLIVEAK